MFRSWEYDVLDSFAALGLADVFAELHPGVQAHSWIGRTGNGYRYDYVFVSRALMGPSGDATTSTSRASTASPTMQRCC